MTHVISIASGRSSSFPKWSQIAAFPPRYLLNGETSDATALRVTLPSDLCHRENPSGYFRVSHQTRVPARAPWCVE